MEYLSYFNDAYLFFFVSKFSYSHKVQAVNPKKVYCIDNGFINANSVSFSNDSGRMLENLVFLELRRRNYDVFYFNESKECDFVVFEKGKIKSVLQVCFQLDEDNMDRVVSALIEAMDYFNLKTAKIITVNQKDSLNLSGRSIVVEPFYEWID